MTKERIEAVLTKIGFTVLPEKTDENLADFGLNSLTLALLIMALEQEFLIKIPVLPIDKSRFISIDSLSAYVHELRNP
jgi:acyl carrier protein